MIAAAALITAALAVISPLRAVRRSELVDPNVSPFEINDPHVAGALVAPRADGRSVSVYWFEGGRCSYNGAPYNDALDHLYARFEAAGWRVERGIHHVRAWAPEAAAAPIWGDQQLTFDGARPDVQQGALFAA